MAPKKGNKSTGTMLTDMAHDSNIRTTDKNMKLESDYVAALADLEEKINAKLAEERQALSTIRHTQLTRLMALVRKRCDIETAIADSHTRLQAAYEVASRELRRSIKFRAEEIRSTLAAATEGGDESGSDEEDWENEAPADGQAEKGNGSKGRAWGKKGAGRDLMEE